MFNYYTSLIVLFLCSNVFAQCPVDSIIYLNNQIDVNNFQTNYPNCSKLLDDLEIRGDISDLTPLSVITSIEGSLYIYTTQLKNLDGLNNLNYVGYNLSLSSTTLLTDILALNNIDTVGHELRVENNSVLPNLAGLSSLVYIGDGVSITNNSSLVSLEGLENLVLLDEGNFYIDENPLLSNCNSICTRVKEKQDEDWLLISNNTGNCNTVNDVINNCITGIENDLSILIEISPNPAHNYIRFQFDNSVSELRVYNAIGKLEFQLIDLDPPYTLNTSELSSGVYYFKASSENLTSVGKFIIE